MIEQKNTPTMMIIVKDGEQSLTLEITQETMIRIENRFRYTGEQFSKTGSEYAFAELVKGNNDVMWEMVRLMNTKLTKGENESIYRLKFNLKELRTKIIDSISDYTMMVPEVDRDREATVYQYDPTKYLTAMEKVNTVNPKASKGYTPTEEEDTMVEEHIKRQHERLMVTSAPEYCDSEYPSDVESEELKLIIRKIENLSNEV